MIIRAGKNHISLLSVDEAHCISQWGQDFRPSYLKISDFVHTLKKRPVIAAFTATATREVREDILALLNLQNPISIITGFDRKNLKFTVRQPDNKWQAGCDENGGGTAENDLRQNGTI